MKTALLSSYKKNDSLVRLAKLLQAHQWDLLGSAGTVKYLSENGIPCRDVADIVGPPILGHRVVTLSRELHAALLSTDADAEELALLNVPRIDLVYVTLYPLTEAIESGASPAEVIEKTDIGGPTLLRSAAKGGRLALSHSAQIDALEAWLTEGATESSRGQLVIRLRAEAERRVANYVAASADYWDSK